MPIRLVDASPVMPDWTRLLPYERNGSIFTVNVRILGIGSKFLVSMLEFGIFNYLIGTKLDDTWPN